MIRLRRIFLREHETKIRRIAGYVTDFCLVLSEKKISKISRYFFKNPKPICVYSVTERTRVNETGEETHLGCCALRK